MGLLGTSQGSSSTDDLASYYAEVGNRVKLINATSPWLSGNLDLVHEMAMDGSVPTQQLASNAGQVAGMMNIDALHQRLVTLNPATQRAVYSGLTSTQQQALGQMGYNAPQAKSAGGGSSGVFGAIGSAIDEVKGVASTAIGTVASPVLHGLSFLGDQPAHLYRTIRTLDFEDQVAAFGGALVAGIGIAAAPFTDGLSLAATAALTGLGGLAAGNLVGAASAKITNGTDWWDAFNHSWDGERTFTSEAQVKAKNLLSGNASIANLAKDVANYGGIDDLARDFAGVRNSTEGNTMLASVQRVVSGMVDQNDPRYQDLLAKVSAIAQDPTFRQAVATLQNGKISMGRDFARVAHLDPGTEWYNRISGAVDGLAVVTLDPFMTMSALGDARMLARVAVPEELLGDAKATARWVNNFVDGNAVASGKRDLLAEAVRTGDFATVRRQLPTSQSQWYDLMNYRDSLRAAGTIGPEEFGAEQIKSWYTQGGGLVALLQGKTSRLDAAHIILDNTTSASSGWARAKSWAKASINFADDNNSAAKVRDVVNVAETTPEALLRTTSVMFAPSAAVDMGAIYPKTKALIDWTDRWPILQQAERNLGALLGSITTATPAGSFLISGAAADAADVDRFTQLGRVVGMPHDVVDTWANFITSQTNPALRVSGIESFTETLLRYGGGDVTPEAREMIERYIGKSHQTFALGGLDTLNIMGRDRVSGVLPIADQAYEMAVPNLKALRQAVSKGSFLHYIFDVGDMETINNAVTKIWKPSVLMRIGFIPRIAADELLGFFAREGMSAYFTGLAERGIAKGHLIEPGVARDTLMGAGASAGFTDAFLQGSAYTNAIKHWNVIAPMAPLERILARYDYAEPIVRIMERSSAWLRQALENGILPDSMVEAMPDGLRKIVLGQPGQLRNLLLNGVDPTRLRAGMVFQAKFAASIMDEAAASSAGLLDTGVRAGRLGKIAMPNPRDPYSLIDRPLVFDERKYFYLRQGIDPAYANGFHASMQHLMSDPIVAEAAGQVLPRVIPGGMRYSEARSMSHLYDGVAPGPVRDALNLALSGKQLTADHIDGWVRDMDASLARADAAKLALIPPGPGATGADLLRNLRQYDLGDPGELDSALDLIKRLDKLPANERAWATMYLPHKVRLDPTLGQDYFLSIEEAQQQFVDHLRAGMLHPEHQPYLKMSMHNLQDADGNPVVRALSQTRTYMPALHDSNARQLYQKLTNSTEVQSMLAQGTSLEEAVRTALTDRLVRLPDLMERSVNGLQDGRKWIDEFARRHFGTEGGDLAGYINDALAGVPDRVMIPGDMLLHDPRVASDMTSLLQSFVTPGTESIANGSGVGFVELGHHEGRYIDNPLALNGRAEMVPTGSQYHQLANGTVQHGVTLEDAVDSWAKVQAERFHQLTTEGVRTTMVPTGREMFEGVMRDGKLQLRKVEEGTPILPDAKNRYFAKIGEDERGLREKVLGRAPSDVPRGMTEVRWGDPRFMDSGETTYGDRYLWDQVGPALRDALDTSRGMARFGPSGNRLYHYTPEDVGRATGMLPNVVFAPAAVAVHPGGWQRAVNGWFGKVVGPSLDAIVRRPMGYHNFVESYRLAEQAQSWLRDGHLIDEVLPKMFGRSWNAGFLDEGAKTEIADTIRSTAKYFDHSVGHLSDEEALGYFRSIDGATIDKAKLRLLNDAEAASPSSGRAIEQDLAGLRQMAALKHVNPGAITASLADVDRNAEAARDLIDQAGKALNKTWEKAQADPAVIRMLEQNPGLTHGFGNGGWEALQRARTNLDSVTERITEIATQRAVINTVPFIHSAEMKSQFADYGSSLMPFWYAQEKFLKRWGRTLVMAPEAIRKAQLAYMGLHSTGLVRTDEQGKDWFIYPGSKLLVDALGKVPGLNVLPVGAAFQAPTSSLIPGFSSDMGTPSFSPFVTVPVATVSALFPQLAPANQAIGGIGVLSGVARQFIPPTIYRTWEAAFGNEHSSTRFASAMMSAAAMLEANGQGLPDDANTHQVDDYLRTLRQHAHTIMIAQAIMGFVSPGSPSEVNTGDTGGALSLGASDPARTLRDEYLQLIRYQGVHEGTLSFLAAHGADGPEGLIVHPEAYTVGMSKSASGAPLPATAGAVAFYDDNREWMSQFPEAGPWLLPPAKTADAFEQDAYTTQTIDGLRVRQTPAAFLTSIKFKEGASAYFRTRDEYQATLDTANATGNTDLRRRADLAWTEYSTGYLNTHPVFADQLTSNQAQTRRGDTITQMRIALADPNAPSSPQAAPLRQMMADYDYFQAQITDLSSSRAAAARAQLDMVKSQYAAYMDRYIFSHPEVESYWTSVLKPTISF